jgi:hypothetical protein
MASPQRPVHRLRDTIQSKLQSEPVQKRKDQAGKALKSFGSQLQKINLGKLIDQMETDQNLANSLEQLNERMKEECERQDIRREAEARSLQIMQDHLEVFLQERPQATYEDWIEDLHPENANQGQLLSEIQEIDARFYVFESDHRQLWNDAMKKLENNEHRIVQPRTQIWGKMHHSNHEDQVDLISGSAEFGNTTTAQQDDRKLPASNSDGTDTETIDFFAPSSTGYSDSVFADAKNDKEEEESEDLIKF